MKEFKTIAEVLQYRDRCPLCQKSIYFMKGNVVEDYFQLRASHNADDLIFKIGIKNHRINYSNVTINHPISPEPSPVANLWGSRTRAGRFPHIDSITPLRLERNCNRIGALNHYVMGFDIVHGGKQVDVIEKIQLVYENFTVPSGNSTYKLKINHGTNKCILEEYAGNGKKKPILVKNQPINYEVINLDKIYNKDYLHNKIQNIIILK